MNKTRKGFTLVELLIVIVVIGILSAMMMMSSSEAVSSAKATAIISNLRNIKTATLAWYSDNMDAIDAKTMTPVKGELKAGSEIDMDNILPYLSSKQQDAIPDIKAYEVWWEEGKSGMSDSWYVYYMIGGTKNDRKPQLTESETTRVKKKLAARAKSTGLIKALQGKGGGPQNVPYDGQGDGHVGMQIR